MSYRLTPTLKRQEVTNTGKNIEKKECLCTICGNEIGITIIVVSQKL